jgi:hypothetical protein
MTKVCIALIATLLYSTALNVYWIKAYYSKDPFIFRFECKK